MNADERSEYFADLKVLLPYFIPYLLIWPFQYANKLGPNAMYITYPLKTITIAVALICLRKSFPELKWKCSIHGVWVGLVALAVWLVPYWNIIPGLPAPDKSETGFNPLQFKDQPLVMGSLILFRVGGASLVIPFVEELLFRSCIARMVIDHDFRRVPVGAFSWASIGITTLAFMMGHRDWEWFGAVLVGLMYHGLVVWRKNILDCVVAHGVTNLGLGIWILVRHEWYWW